jgi:hypothetical protein
MEKKMGRPRVAKGGPMSSARSVIEMTLREVGAAGPASFDERLHSTPGFEDVKRKPLFVVVSPHSVVIL